MRSSFLQKLPGAARWHRYYLPLYPAATQHLDLRGYDLVISSDAAVIKGVRTDAGATHICYCHTPMRCLWVEDRASRAEPSIARLPLAMLRGRFRQWDYEAAQRVTHFVANSHHVQSRIRKSYGRESVVIYPPVDTGRFVPGPPHSARESFFLAVSHLVPYKRIDLIVDAFNQCKRPLMLIGEGPEQRRLARRAGRNIKFLGSLPKSEVIDLMQRCRSLVFAGEEDFGIVMAEAQACGTPVIALNKGGAREIITHGVTGVLFDNSSPESLLHAVKRFDDLPLDPRAARQAALRFARERFLVNFSSFAAGRVRQRAGLPPN